MSDTIITLPKNELASKLPKQFSFICFASFEGRSTTAALALNNEQIVNSVILKSVNTNNKSAVETICGKLPDSKVIELDLNHPVNIAKLLTKCIKELVDAKNMPLVIDITTFTHETLAMILKLVFDNKTAFPSVFLLYNGASDYSDSKKEGLKQMWLSKGCRDVRNIIGYPGIIRPAVKTCLIVLTGFELERATGLINILEPDKLILGIGVEPTHDNNKTAMEYFSKEFKKWRNNYKNNHCSEFEFSCRNFCSAISSITELISANPDDNYIIVPLNTKLSTIAATIVALRNPKLQLCYAIPEIYNTKSYSIPSEDITVLDLFETSIQCEF